MSSNSKIYKVIIIGHLLISPLSILLCFGLPALIAYFIQNTWLKIISAFLLFFIGLAASWLLWSVVITKWRIWAFNQIEEDDWVKLEDIAIEYKLIWEPESEFEKTEIRSLEEKKKIEEISTRISELREVEAIQLDLSTPFKVGYRLNSFQNIAEGLAILFILGICFMSFFTDIYYLSFPLLFYILKDYRELKYIIFLLIPKDYLVLTNLGIQVGYESTGFIKWKLVKDISFDYEFRNMEFILKDEKKVNVELWRIKIKNRILFKKRLMLYWERSFDL